MDPLGIASLAIGGATQIGNVIGQAVQNKKTRQWNEKMYKRQLEDNLRLNSPRAQMQRYQEAGLNPNLIYGTPNSMDVPKPSNWSPEAPKVDSSFIGQTASISSQSAQTDLTRQMIETEKVKQYGMVIENAIKAIDLDRYPEVKQLGIDTLKSALTINSATFDKIKADTDNTRADIRLKEQEKTFKDVYNPLLITKTDSEIQNIDTQAAYTANKIILDNMSTKQSVEESKQRIAESLSRMAVNKEQVQLIMQSARKTASDADIREIEAALYKDGIPPNASPTDRALVELLGSLGPLVNKLDGPIGMVLNVWLSRMNKKPASLGTSKTTTTYKTSGGTTVKTENTRPLKR